MSRNHPLWTPARRLDDDDVLAGYRQAFDLPPDVIYLDGNSLGPLTHATRSALVDTVDREWGRGLIGSWNTADWIGLPQRVGARIARLIGAAPEDVVCCDSTSVNLYKVLVGALSLRASRGRLVAERDNFPTDLYIAAQAVQSAGHDQQVDWLEPGTPPGDALDGDVAVVMLTHVDYRSGAMHDLAEITAQAHAMGALVVWDLAHSAGAMDLDLRGADVDFAVGCGYKYLNGGPGAPAFIYAHPRHRTAIRQPLAGWFAHAEPFAFEPGFRPASDMRTYLTGTPGVLGMRSLEAALSVWEDVDMACVRAKSVALGELFITAVEQAMAERGIAHLLTLTSPREASARASQVSFRHRQAAAVMQALIAEGVVGDMRAPDILRFGFAPLYTRHVDVVAAAEALVDIVSSERYRDPRFAKTQRVT